MGETQKAYERRLRTGWFDKYIPETENGIDIGCALDPVSKNFQLWDYIFGNGDATFMEEVQDDSFHTVYASHVLEHLSDPVTAVKNWYRILKPHGHLIILVPHRDLYEKKARLPSNWNGDHKYFYLPEETLEFEINSSLLCLKDVVLKAIPNANIVSYEILNEGYKKLPLDVHAEGEYSIEIIIKKPKPRLVF